MIFSGFMLVAIVCLADEPTTCARYGLGWMTTAKACTAAARETKLRPPEGYIIRAYACESGRSPDGRNTL